MNGRYDRLFNGQADIYAFTVKGRSRQLCDRVHYTLLFSIWDTDARVHFVAYETDKHGRVHAHGIIYCRQGFKYSLLPREGFSCHFKRLYTVDDKEAWTEYCLKEQDNQYSPKEQDRPVIKGNIMKDCKSQQASGETPLGVVDRLA